MKALHEFFEDWLEPLGNVSVSSLSVTTANEYKIQLLCFLSPFVADIPDTENLLSLKHGSITLFLCCICHISFEN